VQSGIVLQADLDLFERGIARKLDFSYSGPQGAASRALAGAKSSSAPSTTISSCSPATSWI
jgi:Malonate decarboxylase, alpha subunit, transporter